MRISVAINLGAVLIAFLLPVVAFGQQRLPLRIDTNVYPYQSDVDNDTDLTFITNARLPARLSYFSFISFHGLTTKDDFEFTRSEQTLRWSPAKKLPLDLSLQGVLVNGSGNDFAQLGASWRVHHTPGLKTFFDRIKLIYRVTFQLMRFGSADDDAWQIEQYFKMQFPKLSDRLYLSGFIDQTFDLSVTDGAAKNPVVLEAQLGYRLWDKFYAVAEYRSNDFRVGNERNIAAGIEIKFSW